MMTFLLSFKLVRSFVIAVRNSNVVRTLVSIANAAFYLSLSLFLGFIAEQLWDRAQVPFEYVNEWADPKLVAPGEPVRVWVKIIRHKRCRYAISWSITDSTNMVSYFGPITQEAPGDPSPLPLPPYGSEWQTPPIMAAGPAIIRITLRGDCPGNWLDNAFPVEVDMPPVQFSVPRPTRHSTRSPTVIDDTNTIIDDATVEADPAVQAAEAAEQTAMATVVQTRSDAWARAKHQADLARSAAQAKATQDAQDAATAAAVIEAAAQAQADQAARDDTKAKADRAAAEAENAARDEADRVAKADADKAAQDAAYLAAKQAKADADTKAANDAREAKAAQDAIDAKAEADRIASAKQASDAQAATEAAALADAKARADQAEADRVAQAKAVQDAADLAKAAADKDARAAADKAPETAAAAAPKVRPWYATGRTRETGKTFNMSTGRVESKTEREYCKLHADITDAESTDATKGGAPLQLLVTKYSADSIWSAVGAPKT